MNPKFAQVEVICDFVFGKGICCGGHDANDLTKMNTDICGFYDCDEHVWTQIHDFPVALYYEAATVIKAKDKDYGWLVSGGERKNLYPFNPQF